MAVFQEDSARRVKDAADIVEVIGEYVTLQKAGARYKGLCPFHSEKTPSFTVNGDRQFFHCFGCKESGDVFSFLMRYHHMSFPEALENLAERYGIELEERQLSPAELERARQREALFKANETAAALFHHFLLHDPAGGKARTYLEGRGIPASVIESFRLGAVPDRWDFLKKELEKADLPESLGIAAGLLVQTEKGHTYDRFRNRIVCPIFTMSGQVAGFGGRILGDGQPKYLNTPETPVFDKGGALFGLYQNKEAIRRAGRCLIVEGNFDLLSLVARGLDYAAAPLGTALTVQHIRVLKRYTREVVVLFDGDEAGLKAAMRAVPFFLAEELDARIVVLPSEHDPDTFINAFGPRAMEKKIGQALELPEFVFGRLVKEHGLSLAGKAKIVKELQPLIQSFAKRRVQKNLFVSHFSKKLGLKPEDLLDERGPALPGLQSGAGTRRENKRPLSMKERQLLEFLLVYPEFLGDFLEAGIEDVLGQEASGVGIILTRLRDLAGEENVITTDRILETMEGDEKIYISELLIGAPSLTTDTRKAMMAEMLAWVRKQALQRQKTLLVHRINEAQHEGNEILLMELLEKKKEMDEASYS